MIRLALLSALCLAPAAAAADADLTAGTFKLAGSSEISFTSTAAEADTGSDVDSTLLGLTARGYWFLGPRLGLGAALAVQRQSIDLAGGDVTSTFFAIGPALAIHHPVGDRAALFAEASGGFTRNDVEDVELDGWSVSTRGGVALFVVPSVSLDLGIGLTRSWLEATEAGGPSLDGTTTTLRADVGVSVYFGR